MRLVLAGFAAATVTPTLLLGVSTESAESYCDASGYVVHAATATGPSALVRILGSTVSPAHSFSAHLNAVGVRDNTFYAVARDGGPGTRLVRFRLDDGVLVDLPPVQGAPPGEFSGAFVGTVVGDRWILLWNNTIYSVRLYGPDAPKVVSAQPLADALSIGDWAARNGKLLTIANSGGAARLFRIDPATGASEVISTPTGLPATSTYGAIYRIHNILYALNNMSGIVYRIDLSAPTSAAPIAAGLVNSGSDAAACDPIPATPSTSAPPDPSLSSSPMAAAAPTIAPVQNPRPAPPAARPPAARPPAARPPAAAAPVPLPPLSPPTPLAPSPLADAPLPPRPALPRIPPPVTEPAPAEPQGFAAALTQIAPNTPVRKRRWVAASVAILAVGAMLAGGRLRGR